MFVRPTARRYREFDVPDFGRVRIQSLTEREASAYQAGFLNKRGEPGYQPYCRDAPQVDCVCVVDADGKRILNDTDADAIGNGDSGVMTKIQEEIEQHVKFGSDDDLEELAKNSDQIHAADSPTS